MRVKLDIGRISIAIYLGLGVALMIWLAEPWAASTPSPTPNSPVSLARVDMATILSTATPAPQATLTKQATRTPRLVAPTRAPQPTQEPQPSATQEPTQTPQPSATEQPTRTPEPTWTSLPTLTPIPTLTPFPSFEVPTPRPPGNPVFTGETVDPPWWPCIERQIKGNRNSKIYHAPTGRFYDRTYDDVECFNTEEAAEAAGYRRSER